MNQHIKDWIQALSLAVRQRYLESNPNMNKQELISKSKVTREENDKYVKVSIGGVERFAVSKKNEFVYGIKRGIVNKKEDYKNICEWHQWEWKDFYPYKKALYAWKDYKAEPISKTKLAKARRSLTRFTVAESLAGQTWPYTSTTGEGNGNQTGNGGEVGTNKTTENREQRKTTGRNTKKAQRRKED